MDSQRLINDVMGGGLRALNRFARSSLVERFGLEGRARQWLYEGAKRVAGTASTLSSRRKRPRRPSLEFDLRLTEEQQLMRDTLRRFADQVMQPAAREADDRQGPPTGFLEAFDELGAIPMAVPEVLGGAAERPSAVSQMLIVEDLARGDMGLAYAACSPLSFVHALVRWGSEEQRVQLLRAFVHEEPPIASLAIVEPQPLFDPFSLRTTARKRGSQFVLTGRKTLVALAETAHWFLVAANLSGHGPRLFLVERGTDGVTVEAEPSMGLRSAALGTLELHSVRVDQSAMLGGVSARREGVAQSYVDAVNLARIAWGAMALGTAQAVLDYVIPYCNERTAFGEPISHRQAVAFMVANIGIELESMRMLVYRAAARAELSLPFEREACLARTLCADKAMWIGTDGVQLLGGAGFIKAHPMEIWYRHLRAIGVMDGNLLL